MKMIKWFITLFVTLAFFASCTGSILEEELLSSLSQTGAGGIEMDEYIPPGIQFVESTTQGMAQDGFPYLRNNRIFNIKWIIKTCDPVNDPLGAACANFPAGSTQNPDPGFYISRLEYSPDNGITWVQIPNAEDLGGYNDQIQSYSWSIPLSLTDEGNQFKFRLITRNALLKEYFVTSNNFIMDNSPPSIAANSLKINNSLDSPLLLQSPGVNIDFDASDSLSPVDSFCLKDSSAAPTLAHSCWIKISSLGLSENSQLQIRNLKRVLGWIGGAFTFYFWVKDKSGNISALTNDTGDETIDKRTISYSPGRGIQFVKSLAANSDMVNENPELDKTVIDGSNPYLYIKWSFTVDQNTSLDTVAPYNIEYSTNGTVFQSITDASGTTLTGSDISSGVDQSCATSPSQEPTSIDKCYVWQAPASVHNLPIYIRIHIKDAAGFIYSISTNPLNQSTSISFDNKVQGVRLVAGLSDSLVGASALNTKFSINQSYLSSPGGKLVVHDDGRIFVLDATYGILVISQFDGKARVYIKNGTSVDGVAVDDPSLLAGRTEAGTAGILKISLDYQGRLLILENNKIRQVTDARDAQGNLTGERTVKTIVGCLTSPCFYDNVAKNTNYNAKVPKQYWQNAWIYPNEFSFPNPNNDYNRGYRHFTPLPNGDIYFSINAEPGYISTTTPSSANGWRGLDFRIYRPDPDPTKPGKLLPLKLSGYGVLNEPFKPIAELYPSSIGGITFNPLTGTPTALVMQWELCPPSTVGQCEFFNSNHNPKTGQSNGTGTHFFSLTQSIFTPIGIAKTYSGYHYVKYITSRRGELYAFNTHMYQTALGKLNTSTNKFEKILGGAYSGYCPDGTLATACNSVIQDAWISQDNTVFFIDGYQIRMIGSDGRIVTLFGRRPTDRSGFDAMLSTLGRVDNFGKWYDSSVSAEKIIIKEHEQLKLREIQVNGNIKDVAGNSTTNWNVAWKTSVSKPGYSVSNNLANNQMGFWSGASYIEPPAIVNSNNGEVFGFTPDSNRAVQKLIREENLANADRGRWLRLIGNGSVSTPFMSTKGTGSCDGKMNTQCRNTNNTSNHIVAFIPEKSLSPDQFGNPRIRPSQVLVALYTHASSYWQKYYLKLINTETGLQTHFAGNDDLMATAGAYYNDFPNTFSPTPLATTNKIPFPYQLTRYEYDATKDALIVGTYGTTKIGIIQFKTDPSTEQIVEAGNYFNLTNTVNAVAAFTYTTQETYDVIYYCSTGGRLYRRVITPATSSEIQLPLPTGMTCFGSARTLEKTIDTNAGIIKLYFPAVFKGQYMIGEYSVSLDL